MRERWFTTLVVSLVGLGLLTYLVVYSVRENEVAVHERFGKVIRVIRPEFKVPSLPAGFAAQREETDIAGLKVRTRAGWYFKLPWPFDRVRIYDQRIRYVDATATQTSLADLYTVIPRVYATWRISEPYAFIKRVSKGSVNEAEGKLRELISKHAGVVFGQRRLGELVNADESQLEFDRIEEDILKAVQHDLRQQDFGMDVYTLGITWVALPRDVTPAVFARMSQEREREATRHLSEGQARRRQIMAEADRDYETTIQQAQAEAKKILAKAETDALASYRALAKYPDLAIYLRRLEAFRIIAERALAEKRPLTLILDTGVEPFTALRPDPTSLSDGAPPLPVPLNEVPVDAAGEDG